MSKRLKILLIVFGALFVLGGGLAAFFIMTAETPEVPSAKVAKKKVERSTEPGRKTPDIRKKKKMADEPAVEGESAKAEDAESEMKAEQEEAAEKPAKPGRKPKASEPVAEVAKADKKKKPKARPKADESAPAAGDEMKKKPADKPAETAAETAKPGETPEKAAEKAVETAKPGETPEKAAEKAVETAKTGETPEKAAAAKKKEEPVCVLTIVTAVKGKKKEFKTASEFVEKSGLKGEDLRDFSKKFTDTKKDALDALKKSKKKVPAADIKCAEDGVKLAAELAELVDKKFPEKPKKEVYTYRDLDKRDPFMNPFEIPKKIYIVPDNAPPVQRQPAESLKVTGIMWSEKGYRALMITEDGRGFTVKVGDKVGNKGGEITEITKTKVFVTEWIKDIFDNIEVRVTEIRLHN